MARRKLPLNGTAPTLIYGGSFDPPHRAHVELPGIVARRIGAGRIVYIPAGRPPHKVDRPVTPAEHRLAMLRIALRGRGGAEVSTVELDRDGPSYTVDTLRELRSGLGPGSDLRLLIGADMAAAFYDQWRDPQRIVELAEPLVMMRPPFDAGRVLRALPEAERGRWRDRIVEVPLIDVSATDLRQKLRRGRYEDPTVRGMIDSAVLDYIREHRLYRDG